jgi:hypothetical protein
VPDSCGEFSFRHTRRAIEIGRFCVERAYVWFTDFAPRETLEPFGQEVIGALSPPA